MQDFFFHRIYKVWALAGFCTLVPSLGLLAAGGHPGDTAYQKPKTDTAKPAADLSDRGFRNLFQSQIFDPNKPYTAQLDPRVVPFVEDYISSHSKSLQQLRVSSAPYFRIMEDVLRLHGLPTELKYLAVIESNLQAHAVSWAGAVGPWQFMPETARSMGLVVTPYFDERTNYYRSTHAAARYLKQLHNDLGDWLLVIAAYNGGPGRVESAIRRTGSRSFWDIQHLLPTESRNHVKKFIGTHYILEGTGGITTTGRKEWNAFQNDVQTALTTKPSLTEEQMAGTEVLQLQGKYNSVVLCAQTAMDIVLFNTLNPGFDLQVSTEGGFELRLPSDKMLQFKNLRYQILRESIVANIERIQQGPSDYPDPAALQKRVQKNTKSKGGKSK